MCPFNQLHLFSRQEICARNVSCKQAAPYDPQATRKGSILGRLASRSLADHLEVEIDHLRCYYLIGDPLLEEGKEEHPFEVPPCFKEAGRLGLGQPICDILGCFLHGRCVESGQANSDPNEAHGNGQERFVCEAQDEAIKHHHTIRQQGI